jgi:hypothetical protein
VLGLKLKNLKSIDELVLSWIDDYPADEDAELLFGVAGLGVYGLDHNSPALARRIVSGALSIIDERLERSADGSFVRLAAPRWEDPEAGRRRGWRAVGVAHGNAGIAAFLAAVASSPLGLHTRAQPMLRDMARWLVSIAAQDSEYVYYPYLESTGIGGRSSWCHGDAGVSLALAVVARSLSDPKLRAQVIACSERAARAVISRPVSLAGIRDCCVCHGAAFLYYFGQRMSQSSRDACSFAQQWYAYIQDQRMHGSLTYQASHGARRNVSFLGGDSGVVCVLTRAIDGQSAAWERLLLMR